MTFKRLSIALLVVVFCGVVATAKPEPAAASRGMLVGLYDPVQPVDSPQKTFPMLRKLWAQIIRLNLNWNLVAPKRPAHPADPADPAYNWAGYDATVLNAAKNKIQVLFTIYGTPRWANGKSKGINRAPKKMRDLRNFAFAAAKRYSGTFKRDDGVRLPAVRKWLAWNEPNNPVFLKPQWLSTKRKVRVKGKVRIVRHNTPIAAKTYVQICSQIYLGVHATHLKETVGCGVTDPRGNNAARSRRASISPLEFIKRLKQFGLRRNRFDVYAHHPYYGSPHESPSTKPKGKQTVTLANIGVLTKLIGRYWGNRKLWITEYGYQTRPPDRAFGVSWSKQAKYLTQAYKIARKNPRITMMLWFLLKDEGRLGGWQSGLFTASGKRKPAFNAFRRLPH